MRNDMASFEKVQVFLNYPFDTEFRPFADAIHFAVIASGLIPVCTKDINSLDRPRLEMLIEAIMNCHYSIHDFSGYKGQGAKNSARFNMPIETGMALFYALQTQRRVHRCAFFVATHYDDHQFASDLAGLNPKYYDNDELSLVASVYEWLRGVGGQYVNGLPVLEVKEKYREFKGELERIEGSEKNGLPSHDESQELMYKICAEAKWWEWREYKIGRIEFPPLPLIWKNTINDKVEIDTINEQKHKNRRNTKLMSESEDSGKYQVDNGSTVQGQVVGDHAMIHQHFYSSNAHPEDKRMQKIKALFLAANPTSTNRLAIDEEIHAIEQKFQAVEHRDALVFQSAWAVRPDDLLQQLNQHRPHIVHFSGHGSNEGLCLAGENGQARLVTTRALTSLFTTLKDNIRLVFLSACYSREQALALVEIIDCVIGMKESIGDNAAIAFASSFYRAVGFGRSLQEAFEQGITSLLLEGISQEDIPELLVRQGVDASTVHLITSANPQEAHRRKQQTPN